MLKLASYLLISTYFIYVEPIVPFNEHLYLIHVKPAVLFNQI